MKLTFLWLILANIGLSQNKTSLNTAFLPLYRLISNLRFNFNVNVDRSSDYQQILRRERRLQDYIQPDEPFPCNRTIGKSRETPESVHKLRVGDINVIGAMGDSLTAGFGLTASNLLGVSIEDRGQSFSIGGEGDWRSYMTIPNILKEFNPKLVGYSLGPSLTTQRQSQFNVAEGGALSRDMPYMATVLYKRIVSDKRVNMETDWKMINIFVGNNDFCEDMCYRNHPFDVLEEHKNDLMKVLRFFKQNLPRTLINLIPPPNLMSLAQAKSKPQICSLLHSYACPCLVGLQFQDRIPQFQTIMKMWQRVDMELANNPEFDTDNFTVVAQPFFMTAAIPIEMINGRQFSDFSYTGPDCFHFSQKGTALAALNFWNSLLDPVGRKRQFDFTLKRFNCPELNAFIATRRNS